MGSARGGVAPRRVHHVCRCGRGMHRNRVALSDASEYDENVFAASHPNVFMQEAMPVRGPILLWVRRFWRRDRRGHRRSIDRCAPNRARSRVTRHVIVAGNLQIIFCIVSASLRMYIFGIPGWTRKEMPSARMSASNVVRKDGGALPRPVHMMVTMRLQKSNMMLL